MNKVFKVIYSEARNAYVVVSEIAKNHGSKSCSTKKLLTMLIATGVMTCASMAPAMAADPPAEALKHSTVAAGYNITVTPKDNSDGGKEYNVDLKNDIYLAGDDPNAFVNISGSRGTIWASGGVTAGSVAAGDVFMDGATATVSGLSNKTTAYDEFANGKGKAATEEQLKEVATEAGKHTTVTDGANITVTEDLNEDGGKKYKVALNNDILLSGDNDAFVNISGSKGTIWASGSVTAGSVAAGDVFMDGATATVSGLSNTTTAYDDFANGKGKAATEEQLKEVATEAGKHTTVTDGANITVTEDLNADGGKEYKVALNNDIFLSGDNDAFVDISGSKGTIWASSSVAAGNVVMDGASATVSGLSNQTTAYDEFANGKGKAATEEQLKEISKVADNANQGWNLSTNGDAASKVAPGETVDFSGDKNISVSNNGKDVKVELNKDIDVNSVQTNFVQTNALNAKYNLSVGTANVNGTVPFFVNSNGAFYAANGKLVVDKDGKLVAPEAELGKVTADEGVIGNVVLKDGVFYKNSALRDGELFVGDASGNYSQITTKGAKLGKVTIDEQGNIAGANHIQTNALNAKYNLSVGTANENGTVPFFVNSNGAFYAANGKLVVDKDGKLVAPEAELGKVTADEGVIGNVVLKDGVFYKNSALRDGELFIGDADGNYSQITTKGAKLGKVTVAADGKISGVAAGAITADSTDAVNGSQLHAVQQEAGKHTKVVNGSNITVEETAQDGQKTYKVGLNKDILLGDITGKNVSISGTNGTIEATGAIATKDCVYADKGAKLADIDVTGNKISNGASSIVLDGSNVKVNDKVTIDQNGKISGVAAGEVSSTSTDAINGSQLNQTNENVAALDKRVTQNEADIAQNKADIAQNKADIAQNKADIVQNKTDIKNLDNRVTNVEELAKKHTTVTEGDNIAVTESTNKDGGKEYKVALDKDINLDSVTTGQTVMNNDGLKVGKDVSVTATAVTAGKTSISDEGVKVGDKTYISDKGLNANDQKVTNVAAGELSATSKDAVNGSQLYETKQAIANNATNISSLSHSISNLDNRVNKVGAGAAALAALHPLDFDPDAKWDFAAGYGNYRGANAAAVGAYYRPNEDTMFSVGGTFGNGENMVNAGVSFKLGSGSSHVSTSRVAMAKEIKELRGELEAMKSAMLDANAGKKIDTSKLQLFPDVPQNHWAYEYVAQLAGNGMIEGYPDGNFAGDRPMTRYEFAAILYRAMTKGAVLSDKILSEFSHELEYFTVDTIAKDKAGNPTIQRVRTVKENKNK